MTRERKNNEYNRLLVHGCFDSWSTCILSIGSQHMYYVDTGNREGISANVRGDQCIVSSDQIKCAEDAYSTT